MKALGYESPVRHELIGNCAVFCIAVIFAHAIEVSSISIGERSSGCDYLLDLSTEICMAKVDCVATTEAEQKARDLFMGCRAGEPATKNAVNNMVARFGNELQYRCCAGNALNASVGH